MFRVLKCQSDYRKVRYHRIDSHLELNERPRHRKSPAASPHVAIAALETALFRGSLGCRRQLTFYCLRDLIGGLPGVM